MTSLITANDNLICAYQQFFFLQILEETTIENCVEMAPL